MEGTREQQLYSPPTPSTSTAAPASDASAAMGTPSITRAQMYAVGPIPPHRTSTSSIYGAPAEEEGLHPGRSKDARQMHQQQQKTAHQQQQQQTAQQQRRERRSSQMSTSSTESSSTRRNSGQINLITSVRYPSPAPSSPGTSHTHAQAQFAVPSSPSSTSGYAAADMASSSPPSSSSFNPRESTRRSNSQSSTMLQGIEAQLQIPPFRGGPAANTRAQQQAHHRRDSSQGSSSYGSDALRQSTRSGNSSGYSSNSGGGGGRGGSGAGTPRNAYDPRYTQFLQQQPPPPSTPQASGIVGPTHRIPAVHQAPHRPASTTVVPVQTGSSGMTASSSAMMQTPSQQASLYPYSTPDNRAILSQSTRGAVTAPPPQQQQQRGAQQAPATTSSNSRNRASHQIIPISQTPASPPIAIALHVAQYNNTRQKIYFGNYQLLHTLGEGEFGKVKLGVHTQRWGEEVAIKLIKRGNIEKVARQIKVQREIDVLRAVRHPHIARLHEVIETDRYIGIVLEYASGGELFEYILAHKYLRENVSCKLFAQLVSGVAYLHAKKIVHRDLKLENLLLDRNRNIIITDFGFANRFNAETGSDLMTTSCGSPCYAAPELVLHDGMYVASAVDVWSCGVILYAMLSGYLPFDDDPSNPEGDNINQLYKYITTTTLTFPDWVSPGPRDLLSRMLVPDPTRRCSLRDVMRHPWLRRYSPLFQYSVEELEAQADAQYKEKQLLLLRQKEEHFRRMSQSSQGLSSSASMQINAAPSPQTAMSRSMSNPGGVSAEVAQQRHRSAVVASTPMTLSQSMAPSMSLNNAQHLPSDMVAEHPHISESTPVAPRPNASRRAQAQSAIVVPTQSSLSSTDPFTAGPPTAFSYQAPSNPVDPALLSSSAMLPSSSAPGEVETASDSFTSEGDLRGEPRSRRTDEDDASTNPATRPNRQVVPPSTEDSAPELVSDETKKRKGGDKRHTVQLEYTSPLAKPDFLASPADSTRSKSRARESFAGPASEFQQSLPTIPASGTDGSLAEILSTPATATATAAPTPSSPLASPTRKPLQAIAPSTKEENSKIPILQASAAADTIDVNMGTPDVSLMQAQRAREEPVVLAVPKVSPVSEASEAPVEGSPAPTAAGDASTKVPEQRTPPPSVIIQPSKGTQTPRRGTTGSSAPRDDTEAAIQPERQGSTQESKVPFPSPKQDRKTPTPSTAQLERNGSTRENVKPPSAKATRHKKGLSLSRFLGSSTTSLAKTDATGQGSRSRHSSTFGEVDRSEAMKASVSSASVAMSPVGGAADLEHRRSTRRRKALSLVVDPFSKSLSSSTNSASSPAANKNRRSARLQTASSSLSPSPSTPTVSDPRVRTDSSASQKAGSALPPSMSTSAVGAAASSQHANAAPSQIPQPVYHSSRPEPTKSKRVSDWFRWKSVTRDSSSSASASHPGVAPSPIKTDFDRRQSASVRSSLPADGMKVSQSTNVLHKRQTTAPQPTVVVTSAMASQPFVHTANALSTPAADQRRPERVVATPAEARALADSQARQTLTATRALRARAAGTQTPVPTFDDSKLKVHSGATDKRIVTKTSPPLIMVEVERVLQGMGIDIVKDTDFRFKCTRKSKKQAAAALASSTHGLQGYSERRAAGSTISLALSPSPSSTFRSFFGRKNSSPNTSVLGHSTVAMPSPALTNTSSSHAMDSPDLAALSPTMSPDPNLNSSINVQPYFGTDASTDSGSEVRFTVEVTKVKGLTGLYTLDFRRMKGTLYDYKENHETFIERLNLASAL